MSICGLIAGTHTLLVGVEDQEDGALRLYLGARYRGLYVVVDDPDAQAQARAAWATGGHVTIPVPPVDCIHHEQAAGVSAPSEGDAT
jgi:hypothetical protein